MTLTAQTQTTPEFSPPVSPQPGNPATTTGGTPAPGLFPVETATESPQPAPLAMITANPLIMLTLAFVILNNVLLLVILLRKPGKKYLRDLIKSKSPEPMQKDHLIKRFQSQMKNQQDLLQFMKQKQQTLLQKTEDMEQSIERIKRPQTVASAPFPGAMDNPQSTPRLSPADHLVQVLEQGGDRAALAQWSAVGVKITAASQNRIHRGDTAGVALEPTQAGASFLVFQVNGENLLVPNRETLGIFQRYQRGHTGLFVLKPQSSQPTPQVSKPARVQPQGKHWRVLEQGEVLIRG